MGVWLMAYSAQSFTLLGFLVLFVIQEPAYSQSKVDSSASDFSIQLTTMREGYDGKFCWVHARTGMIPTRRDSDPIMVMTSQKLQLSGSARPSGTRIIVSCTSALARPLIRFMILRPTPGIRGRH